MKYIAIDFYIDLKFLKTNLISHDHYAFHSWRVAITFVTM